MKKSYSTLSGSIAFFLIINGGSIAYLILFISNLFNFEFRVEKVYMFTKKHDKTADFM